MNEATARDEDLHAAVAPEFFVSDLERSLGFYREKLGFRSVFQEPDFAIVALGNAFVMLATPDEAWWPNVKAWLTSGPRGVGLNIRIMVDDVDAMYERAVASGARFVLEIGDRDYGLRDFMISDPDGFVLRFASPIER